MSSQLQHKLQNFEATPPEQVWLAIEDQLNHTQHSFQSRLEQFETTPPANSWNEIAASLSDATVTPEKTTSFTNRKWFRYAAAAVVLGVIALSVLTYAINQPKEKIALQPVLKQQKPTPEVKSGTVDNTKTTPVNNKPAEAIIPIKEESISLSTTTSAKEEASTTKLYKVVAKEDGQLVRLSQKAYAVFDCAGKANAQKNINCKENIQNMQAKMASSLISPTTDFAGLIDMIKTLEENK